MRRRFAVLLTMASCLFVFLGQEVYAAPAPVIKVTLSDYTPSPGQYVAVWLGQGPKNYKVRVYIDSTSRTPVATMITSATGYGRATFRLSKYAKVGSRHSVLLLLNAWSGANVRAPFTVER